VTSFSSKGSTHRTYPKAISYCEQNIHGARNQRIPGTEGRMNIVIGSKHPPPHI